MHVARQRPLGECDGDETARTPPQRSWTVRCDVATYLPSRGSPCYMGGHWVGRRTTWLPVYV